MDELPLKKKSDRVSTDHVSGKQHGRCNKENWKYPRNIQYNEVTSAFHLFCNESRIKEGRLIVIYRAAFRVTEKL